MKSVVFVVGFLLKSVYFVIISHKSEIFRVMADYRDIRSQNLWITAKYLIYYIDFQLLNFRFIIRR